MKKFLTLLAFAGLIATVNAQSTEITPDKDKAAKVEKASSCAGKAEAKEGKACCASKAGAKAEATNASGTMDAASAEGKAAGCCAAKASAGAKSCHGGDAKADAGHGHGEGHGDGHGHDHGEAKDHSCTAACKDGAHATACGEKGHVCSEACHAKKM